MNLIKEPVRWITHNGKHIPIYADENGKEYVIANKKSRIKTFYVKSNLMLMKDFKDNLDIKVDEEVGDLCSNEMLSLTYDVLLDIQKTYGNLDIPEMKLMDTKKTVNKDGTISDDSACIDTNGNLLVNADIFGNTRKEVDETYKYNAEMGSCVKGDARTIIAHEAGHALFTVYVMNNLPIGKDFENDYNNIISYCNGEKYNKDILNNSLLKGLKEVLDNVDSSKISNYATTNYNELIAESFADVYSNGKNAAKESWVVYSYLFGKKA